MCLRMAVFEGNKSKQNAWEVLKKTILRSKKQKLQSQKILLGREAFAYRKTFKIQK